MSQNFNKLKELLKELFQLDRADLDFGIYRIINKQRKDVTKFLNEDLLPQVKAAFNKYQSSNRQVLQEELAQTIENAKSAGFNPDDSPKVKELKEKIANIIDVTALEEEVYSHLYSFFRRYYSEGDFLSLRRYKEGVYAIPYEGEEVKLHWANADQYYIKSSENLRNYAFKLPSGSRVKFEVVAATLEKDNNKAANGKERKFYLCENEPFIVEGNDLIFRFEYQANSEKQEVLNTTTCERIFSLKGLEKWQVELSQKQPTEKNRERTLLEKYITDFTAKNTFDYFIHKDLGGFLRRELDFYIKTEVMHLDDIENETALRVERYLDQIKALRQVAHKIITFVEQIENFQKKLWLKKKFVVETNYCITLDRVSEELYSEIIENTEQIEEWKRLFAIDEIQGDLVTPGYSEPLTVAFLKDNQFLILDTKFFSQLFKNKLIENLENLDSNIDGLMVKSENFQALNLLTETYKCKVKSIYIDPPYNTQKDIFIYKDGYKNSSWLSMLFDRINIGKNLLNSEGVLFVSIDENEVSYLKNLLTEIFVSQNYIGTLVWKNASNNNPTRIAIEHEYILCVAKDESLVEPAWKNNFSDAKEILLNEYESLRKQGLEPDHIQNMIRNFIKDNNETIGEIERYKFVDEDGIYTGSQSVHNPHPGGYDYEIIHPDTGKPMRKPANGYRFPEITMREDFINKERIIYGQDENRIIQIKVYLQDYKDSLRSVINVDGRLGAYALNNFFGQGNKVFDNPKAPQLIKRLISFCSLDDTIILDFFCEYGSTIQAVIEITRQTSVKMKYITVEMGEYFNTVLKPRIQKVIYSKDWKDGKPISREGISHCFKYIRLESYEDALNNIEISKLNQPQQLTLEQYQNFRESYMLSYMLEMETKGSASLLNVEAFDKPFDYKLKIWQNDEFQKVAVDLVETFNYLLGLNVQRIQTLDNVKIVKGINRQNQNVLIIWRDLDEIDNDTLEQWFKNHFTEHEFDLIYVNCDNNLANTKPADANWQVLLTEAEFKRLMFDIQDI